MFGKNKVSQEDIEKLKRSVQIDDQFFADAGSKGEMFYATMAEIKESALETSPPLSAFAISTRRSLVFSIPQ